jgi:hypothetical protein
MRQLDTPKAFVLDGSIKFAMRKRRLGYQAILITPRGDMSWAADSEAGSVLR